MKNTKNDVFEKILNEKIQKMKDQMELENDNNDDEIRDYRKII